MFQLPMSIILTHKEKVKLNDVVLYMYKNQYMPNEGEETKIHKAFYSQI